MEQLESRKLLSGDAVAAAAAGVVQTEFSKYQPLDRLYQEYLTQGTSAAFSTGNSLFQVVGDRVAVDLSAEEFNADLQSQLESVGMQITTRMGTQISGWVPIEALPELSSISGVRAAAPAYRPMTNVGSVTSQGDAVMRSDDVRRYLGYDGTGITVGVLSDSFNRQGGYAADVASGDLPAGIRVLSEAPWGTDEGRAMLQLIHDVAPGASLMFATTYGGEATFAQHILDLANAGADVIVDDVQYFSEPMFMDGFIAQAVDTVVGRGIPYFTSAGNQARLSYQTSSTSGFRPSGQYVTLGGEYQEQLHNFSPVGVDPYQQITVPVGTGVIVSFQWAEPFYSLVPKSGGVKSDLDIILYPNDVSQEPITGSASFSLGRDPVEVFEFMNDGTYDSNHDGVPDTTFQLAIGQWNTSGTPPMKYVMYQIGDRSKGTVTIDEYATNSGTCYGHANAEKSLTVAAAFYQQSPEYQENPPVVEPFSSAGGTPILLNSSGNRIAPVQRNKPDVTGPDGTSTTFFGSQTGDDRTGQESHPSFFGTSAAAPHVAGVAALLLQSRPGSTYEQIYSALKNTALDMGEAGRDAESGYGLVRATDAILELNGPMPLNIDAGVYANNGGVDAFRIVRDGSRVQFYINNLLSLDVPVSGIQSININGSNDPDSLTVDFSGGPIAVTINFEGGSGTNVLNIQGGWLSEETYTWTSATAGTIDCGTTDINYQEVAGITDLATADQLIIMGSAGVDSINVGDGTLINGVRTARISSGNGAFVAVTAANKANITVDTGEGDDTVQVLSTLAGVITTVTSETSEKSSDVVTIGEGGSVQRILGELRVTTSSGTTRLDVDDSADSTPRMVSIVPEGNWGVMTGLAPAAIRVNPGSMSAVTIRGGRGGNAVTIAVGDNQTLPAMNLECGSGNDTVNVSLTALADVGKVQIAGQGGADTFNLMPLSRAPLLGAAISVDGGPAGPGDLLNIDGGGGNWGLNGTDLTTTAGRQEVNYSGIESIGLDHGTFVASSDIVADVNVRTATLAGNPAIQGKVAVGAGGKLSPGTGVGTMGTMGTQQLSFVAESTLAVDLQGKTPGTGYDQIAVVGTVALQNASLALSIGGLLTPGDVFVIVRNDGSDLISGTFAQGSTIVLGPDTFTIDYAYDGDGDGNKNDVAVTYVGSTNTSPVAKDDAIATNEDTPLTISAATLLNNDSDADKDPLTITSVSGMDPTKGTVELKDGQVIFTPFLNFNGTASFTYTISDGRRGTAVGTVRVSVAAVNDAPTLEAILNPPAAYEGELVSFQAKANDVDGNHLTFGLVNAPGGATIDPTTGVFSWMPGYEAVGSYQFNVTVADNGTPSLIASQAVSVVVKDVPLAAPITAPAGGQEGSPIDAGYGGVVQAGMSFAWSVRKNGVAYSLPAGTVTNQSTFRFTPSSEGNYELMLLVVNPGGSRVAGVKTVQVANVAPVVNAGSDEAVGIGSLFSRSGSFTDSGADYWAATVNYGDSGELPLTLTGKSFVLSHRYTLPGTYRVVVTVNDGVDSRSTSFWVTAIETSFRVVSVTPTASGFDLDFNRVLNIGKLNLYDGFDTAVDPADMMVVGQKSGALAGSLIVDAEQPSTLHWVRSGGVLAADDYAVTLFSRSDGFVDATGELLDGDANGTAGGNYQGSFKVTRGSERIVSLPDLARGPRQSMSLPMRIDNAADVRQMDLELVYDPELLTVNDVALATSMPAGWNVTKTVGAPGHLTISMVGAAPLPVGARDLLSISASVPADAPYGAAQAVQLRGVQINGKQDISVLGDSAVLVAAYVGDTTGNGKYSGVDASYIAAVSIGLISGFDAYPRIDPVIIGDATASGTLSALDASFVAQKSVGLPRPEIPNLPGAAAAAPLAAKATASATSSVASPNQAQGGSRSAARRVKSYSEIPSTARLRGAVDSGERAAFSSMRILPQEAAGATTMEILMRQRAAKARMARAGSCFSSARWSRVFEGDF